MRNLWFLSASILLAILLASPSGSSAQPRTIELSFTASGFTDSFGNTPPTDPVEGSARLTIDPSVITGTGTEILPATVESLSLEIDGFTHTAAQSTASIEFSSGFPVFYTIAGTVDGSAAIQSGAAHPDDYRG